MKTRRMRVRYAKKYPATLTGHLDTVKEIIRGMRRASWPFKFTAGYNPTVKYSSTPALSLGYLSQAEYVDVSLQSYFKDYKREIFKKSLAEGLQIVSMRELSPQEKEINEIVEGFRYKVESRDKSRPKLAGSIESIEVVEEGEEYILIDTFKKDGGIKNPRKILQEGNYSFEKLNCIFSDDD